MNNSNLIQDVTALNGTTAPIFATGAAAEWCGAYSWEEGSDVCKLQVKGDDATANSAGGQDAGNRCFKINNAKTWADATEPVRAAYALVTTESALQSAADTQAALEKAWLKAWYKKEFWVAIATELTVSTVGSQAKVFNDLKVAVDGNGVVDNTTTAGAVAAAAAVETLLSNAQEALATLQATTATALATKAELGKRILRAGVELAELGQLANVGKTGTLDEAKKLRDSEVADYTAAGAAFALAYTELRAASGTPDSETNDANIDAACANATCPVKARDGTTVGSGGALTEAQLVAKGVLDQAVIDQ